MVTNEPSCCATDGKQKAIAIGALVYQGCARVLIPLFVEGQLRVEKWNDWAIKGRQIFLGPFITRRGLWPNRIVHCERTGILLPPRSEELSCHCENLVDAAWGSLGCWANVDQSNMTRMTSLVSGDKFEATVATGSVDEDGLSDCCKESSTTAQARLSVSVPRGLGRKIKLMAHDRDMTVSELLLHLIKSALR